MKTEPSYIPQHSVLAREVFILTYTSTWTISKHMNYEDFRHQNAMD